MTVSLKESSPSTKKYVQYEHQAYIEKGLPSLTISGKDTSKYTNRYQKYSVFDRTLSSPEALRRNILILSEALVKLIYNFQDKSINFFLDTDSTVCLDFINQVATFL